MKISLQGRLLQWSKWSWRGLCPLICVHVSQWAERRVDAGLKNILRRPDWTRLQRYFNGRLTWFPTKKKISIATFTSKIFQFFSLSAQYTMHSMKKKEVQTGYIWRHIIYALRCMLSQLLTCHLLQWPWSFRSRLGVRGRMSMTCLGADWPPL